MRGVPRWVRWAHANAAIWAFGGAPYGATKRSRTDAETVKHVWIVLYTWSPLSHWCADSGLALDVHAFKRLRRSTMTHVIWFRAYFVTYRTLENDMHVQASNQQLMETCTLARQFRMEGAIFPPSRVVGSSFWAEGPSFQSVVPFWAQS